MALVSRMLLAPIAVAFGRVSWQRFDKQPDKQPDKQKIVAAQRHDKHSDKRTNTAPTIKNDASRPSLSSGSIVARVVKHPKAVKHRGLAADRRDNRQVHSSIMLSRKDGDCVIAP